MEESAEVSPRVRARVYRDFPDPEVAAVVIELLEEWGRSFVAWEVDRVQTAIVLFAAGDVDRYLEILEEAYWDYRDVLMISGFGGTGWKELMEAAIGSE
ncbi:hypothetical protein ACFQ61_25785 [Streptomyces sp. NPDC056500]|uniref:hypothetical protein n=1 Tax=Streptomyces sp. NPDC056500 TaxID=3345840 RepID=UPI00369EBE71